MPAANWDDAIYTWDDPIAAWDSAAQNLGALPGRNPCQLVEITIQRCTRRCGVSPCTGSTIGPKKCYNTLWTCQDTEHYVAVDFLIYAASQRIDELQVVNGLPCFPTLTNVDTAATEIQPTQGLGVRAQATITIQDAPYSDLNFDYYALERGYDPQTKGTFFAKLMARVKYFENKKCRVLNGYLNDDGSFSWINFRSKTYFLQDVSGPDASGVIAFNCKDPLRWADEETSQCPVAVTSQLSIDISETDTVLQITNIGDIPDATQYVRIDDEIMKVFAIDRIAKTITVQRATMPSWYDATAMTVSTHSQYSNVQNCVLFDGDRIDVVLYKLLSQWCKIGDTTGIPDEYLDVSQWNVEASTWFATYFLHALITEPTDVKTLLDELGQHLAIIWWNERTAKIELTAIKPAQGVLAPFTDDAGLRADTVSLSYDVDCRISQAWIYYGMRTPIVENSELLVHYRQAKISADLDAETISEYGKPQINTIISRWLTIEQSDLATEITSRLLAEFRNSKQVITFDADPKDDAAWTTDYIMPMTRYNQSVTGDPFPWAFQILSSQESYNDGNPKITYMARATANGLNSCAIIGPDTLPDYASASIEQKATFGWIGQNDGTMLDGSPGYVIC